MRGAGAATLRPRLIEAQRDPAETPFPARGRRRYRTKSLYLATALCTGIATPVLGESAHSSLDANGVDLVDGTFNLRLPVASIGAGQAELPLVVYDSQLDNWSGISLYRTVSGGVTSLTINLARGYDRFTSTDGFAASKLGTGATLTEQGDGSFIYATLDGTTIQFTNPALNDSGGTSNFCTDTNTNCHLLPASISRRGGMAVQYSWTVIANCTRPRVPDDPRNCNEYWRLGRVSNAAGYAIGWSYVNPTGSPVPAWYQRATATLSNSNMTATSWPTVTYAYPSSTVMTVTTPGGKVWRITGNPGTLTGVRRPSAAADTTVIARSGSTMTITKDGVTTTYNYSVAGSTATTTVTDAASHAATYVADLTKQRITSVTDRLGHTTTYVYDSVGRPTEVDNPEGDKVQYGYDGRGNLTTTTQVAKPGSGLANLVTSATFAASCTDASCNEPTTTADAKSQVTNYSYDGTTGLVTAVTLPAPTSGAVRPETRYSYTTTSGVALLTGVFTCRTGAAPACVGTADETKVTIGYSANLLPTSVTAGASDGSLTAATAKSYDAVGNLTSVDGPLPGADDTLTYRWSADREQVGAISPDPDGAGPLKRRAVRTSYNADGQPTTVEQGTVNGTGDTDWAAFTSLQQATTGYDANARPVQVATTAGGTTYAVTQTSYDALGRPDCTAVRMNPASFGSLPGACTAGAAGSDGPDRITRVTVYDNVGRATEVTSAYGTAAAGVEKDSFTINGKVQTVTDANNNVTTYGYDGFDRLLTTTYPGGSYEQLGHDANGNVTSRLLRDGNSISYGYDALNRMTSQARPAIGYNTSLAYAYDNLGEVTGATGVNWSGTNSYAYDALGRMLSENNPWTGTTSWQYDLAGRRTRQTWVDGFYVTYEYLLTGEMTWVRENGSTMLASYGYDDLGRRTALARGNGVNTSYGYDPASRLTSLAHDLDGTIADQTIGLGYNAAGQITSRTSSNDAYTWSGAVNVDRSYSVNGLNQYTASGAVVPSYDGRGNLTGAGGDTYGYNGANQLVATSTSELLIYDPAERLFYSGAENTLFRYDGGQMIAEHDATYGTVKRRYVWGPGDDEPLVWYEGSGTTDKRWLVADERGSVIAVTNTAGDAIDIKAYDEYGIPSDTTPANAGRFGYTGQAWLPSLGMWYYKARVYSPTLGRFLQTDPIGYGDGLNWYNYVGSDPVNGTDPSGLDEQEGKEVRVTGSRVEVSNQAAPRSMGGSSSSGQAGPVEADPQPSIADIIVKGVKDHPDATAAVGFIGFSLLCPECDLVAALAEAADVGEGEEVVVTAAKRRNWFRRLIDSITGRSACFAAGTLVQTEHGLRAIDTIRPGDMVLSRDEKTGRTAYKRVTAVKTPTQDDLYTVELDVPAEKAAEHHAEFQATATHPWRTTDGRWVATAQLHSGMTLMRAEGAPAKVEWVRDTHKMAPTYNLTIEGYHTYFIGKDKVWVHNACSINALGRSLAKKFGRPGSAFPRVNGDAEAINEEAQLIHDEIMNDPGSVQIGGHSSRYGSYTDTIAPDGRGVRYTDDGQFIGFREP